MNQTLFLQPLDILILRANKLFGDAGSYGESMALPWPSVAAGAIRSRVMADYGLAAQALQDPKQFTLTAFGIAQQRPDGALETAHPLPADVVVQKAEDGALSIRTLKPQALHTALQSSAASAQLPVLTETLRAKAASGYWLNGAGWNAYLAGRSLEEKHLIQTSTLWQMDNRIGVGLSEDTRAADDGKLFTTQAVAFQKNVGFVATFNSPHTLKGGLLRLGGDGRAAAIQTTSAPQSQVDCDAIAKAQRFRIVLTTPGLFPDGWKLPGLAQQGGEYHWQFHGIKARLVSAAVPRAEVISGWDMAKREPKPAQRVAPTGSVYWLELLEGSSQALRNISEHGLWLADDDNAARQAEGFNRCAIAHWPP